METINDRIKELRSMLELTQQEFAEKINLQWNTISRIENGSRNPSERTLKDIALSFGVNLIWLTNGVKPIFVEMGREEEIAAYMGKLLNPNNNNEFMKKFIHMLSKLNVEEWEAIERMATMLANENE